MSMHLSDKIQVVNQPKVNMITLDYSDWGLYSDEPSGSLAKYLNQVLVECVNDGLSQQETRRVMIDLMLSPSFAGRGATRGETDSEPMRVLEILLYKIYVDNA